MRQRFLTSRLDNLDTEENQIKSKGIRDRDDFRRLDQIAAEKLQLERELGRQSRRSTRRSARLSKQQERLEEMDSASVPSEGEIQFASGTDIRSMLTNLDILHSELEYARSELNAANDADDVRAVADYINCVQKDAMKEQAEIQCSTCKKGRHARKAKSGLYQGSAAASALDDYEEEEQDEEDFPEYQSGISDSLYEIDRLSKELDDVYQEQSEEYQEPEAQIQSAIFGELAKIQCNTCGGKNKKKKNKIPTTDPLSRPSSSRIRERLDVENSMRVLDLNTGEYDVI